MASRKIKGTKHVRRKMKTIHKAAIGAAAVVLMGLGIWGLSAKGILNTGKIAGLNKMLKSDTISVEIEESGAILGGEGSAKGMIIVTTLPGDNGTVTGDGGTLDKTGNSIRPEDSPNYLTFGAKADTDYVFDKWEIYNTNNEKISEVQDSTLRVYYYDDPSMLGNYDGDGFTAYITDKRIEAKPVFMQIPPAANGDVGSSSGRRNITVITSPAVGETFFWIWPSMNDKSSGWLKNGRTGYLWNFHDDDSRAVEIYNIVNGAERTQFYGEDPRFDCYMYKNSMPIKSWLDKQDGKYNITGAFQLDPGDYTFVVVPHLKTGYLDKAVLHVEPNSLWGSATWNGSQVIATPSEGYMFDHWEWSSQNQLQKSKDNPLPAKPTGVVLYTAYFKEAQYKVDMAGMTPSGAATISGLGTFKKGTDVTIKVTPKTGYRFKDATWTTENGIYHHAAATINPAGVATFTVPNVEENIFITFDFDTDKFTIDAKANPSELGTVSVENQTNPTAPGPLTKESFIAGDKAKLVATPNADNVFLYWEDSSGNRYENAELTFDKVYLSETFTAHFAPKNVKLTLNFEPTGGEAELFYTDGDGANKSITLPTSDGKHEISISPNTNVVIHAKDEFTTDGGTVKKFSNYVITGDTNRYNDNPFILSAVKKDTNITAYYVDTIVHIKTSVEPTGATGCTADIYIDGENKHDIAAVQHGQEIELRATAGDGWNFLYFKDGKGKKISDLKFKVLNGDETFTAVFVKNEVAVTTMSQDPSKGDVKISYTDKDGNYVEQLTAGTYKVKGGSPITLTGLPKDGFHIKEFTDQNGTAYPVPEGADSVVIPNVIEDSTYTATFEESKFRVGYTVSPANGGSVKVTDATSGSDVTGNPARITAGHSMTITATPSEGYRVLYIKDNNTGDKYFNASSPVGSAYTTDPIPVNSDMNYVVYFAKGAIPLTISIGPTPDAGSVEIQYTSTESHSLVTTEKLQIDDIDSTEDVVLVAKPKIGYKFKNYHNIINSTDFGDATGEYTFAKNTITGPTNIEAIFEPLEYTIKGVAEPGTLGKVEINEGLPGDPGYNAKHGETVTIWAIPEAGKGSFKYFEDSKGNKYGGTDGGAGKRYLSVKAVNGNEVYKAVFGLSNIHIKVDVDPVTKERDGTSYLAGGYSISYTDIDGTPKSEELFEPGYFEDVKGVEDVEITAIPKSGYKFVKFTDTDGGTYTENPLIYSKLPEHKDITIHFVPDEAEIKAVSYPEMGGVVTVNGREGGNKVQTGQPVTITAINNEGYTFKYFKDAAGNVFVSNPLEFNAVNGNETYTAYFVKDEITITLDLTPAKAGTVKFNDKPAVSERTTYTTDGRSNVKIEATPKEGNEFVNWRDQDGKVYPDNPLTIVDISQDLTFTAVFDSKITGIRAVASPASGGRIRKIINDDGSIKLIASANKGYKFKNWKKGDKLLTSSNSYVISAANVKDGDVYTAYFEVDPNYDPKSDITKEKFYREWRKVITPNYTVTRDSMKLLAMQTVAGLHQYDDATPNLKSYGAIANAEAYFDEKVAKAAARLDARFGDSELMTAEGEVLIPDLMPDFITYEKLAQKFTDAKFGSRYDTEILTVKRVLEPDEFNDIDRTYLWRYTGAEYKDNIYLLYNISSKSHDWATPIVDEDGVIKFTLDKLPDEDVVAVVRVKIKQGSD